MGHRRDRLNKRLSRAIVTRRENSLTKTKERTRREEQMQAILKQGELPYTPGVMSWLSGQLGKRASRVTPEDVKSLLG